MATKKTPEQIAAEKTAKEQKAKEKAEKAAAVATQKEAEEKAAQETAAREAAERAAETGKKTKQALAKEYAKLYPKNKTFYVTSDDQVFLEGDKSLALLHQNSLATGEEIETINV